MKFSWNPKWTLPVMFVGGIVVGGIIATLAVLILRTSLLPTAPPVPPVQDVSSPVPDPEVPTEPRPPVQDDQANRKPQPLKNAEDGVDATLSVSWLANPQFMSNQEIENLFVQSGADQKTIHDIVERLKDGRTYADEHLWKAGTVTTPGRWKNASVYLLPLYVEEMGGGTQGTFLVKRPDASDLLFASSLFQNLQEEVYLSHPLLGYVQNAPNLSIDVQPVPETLTMENGVRLVQRTRGAFGGGDIYKVSIQSEESLREIGRTRQGYTVYTRPSDITSRNTEQPENNGCLVVFGEDGKEYVFTTEIIPSDPTTEEVYGALMPGEFPRVQWNAGYQNTDPYLGKRAGGCGSYGCLYVASEAEVQSGGPLIVIGKTEKGEDIFAPRNPAAHPIVKSLYDIWHDPKRTGDKPDINAFLLAHPVPVFFWKDGLNRWISYRIGNVSPPAECGKPVIYLYPEQTTDVSVRLPSFINVTVSDPSYPSEGWRVTAQPNGTLTDKRDGKTYGSLYWEGTGVGYATPSEGWVVQQDDVRPFLKKALAEYGLNAQEAKDFMEFWVPKMTGAPYYRVSFLTTAWNQAAPLYVSPRPQSVIRIFMDWKPLSAPITITPPKIATPIRDGFTLVEWGGTLWK